MIRPRHLRLPRALLLWWSLWLLGSWMMAFGWRWWLSPSIATYMMASRRMMLSVMLGIAIVWPLYRLVLRPAHTPRLLPLLDWLAIFVTLQVLLWPMRVPTQWSALEVVLIDATICAWGLLYAALISLGTMGAGRRHRSITMIACIALAAVGPFVACSTATIASIGASRWLHWSPITGVWVLIGRTSITIEPAAWQRIGIIAGAALLAWLGLMLLPVTPRPHRSLGAPRPSV